MLSLLTSNCVLHCPCPAWQHPTATSRCRSFHTRQIPCVCLPSTPGLVRLQTLEVVLTGDGYPEDQVTCAPHLMGVILQNCRGRVDHCVGEWRR
jgi:hypothetical protein